MLVFPFLEKKKKKKEKKKKVRALENEFLKCCPISQAPLSYIRLFEVLLRSLRSKVGTVSGETASISVVEVQGLLYIHHLKQSSQVKALAVIHHFRGKLCTTLEVNERQLITIDIRG